MITQPRPRGLTASGHPCRCSCHSQPGVLHFKACCFVDPAGLTRSTAGLDHSGRACRCPCHTTPGAPHAPNCCEVRP